MICINNIIECRQEFGNINMYGIDFKVDKELLIPLVTINIIKRGNVDKEIAKIFNTNKEKYIDAYKNSVFYENLVYDSEQCEVVSCAKKLAGIYEANNNDNDFSDFIKISRKAFNKVYRNISNTGEVYLSDIRRLLGSHIGVAEETLMIVYILGLENIQVLCTPTELDFLENVLQFYCKFGKSNKELALTNEEHKENEEGIKNLKKILGLDSSVKKLGDIITRALTLDLNNHNKKCALLSQSHRTITVSNDFENKGIQRSEVFDLMTYITAYNDLFFQYRLNSMNLFRDVSISQKEIDYILNNTYIHRELLNFDEKLIKMYAISSFYIYGLYKEYRDTRDRYLREYTEDFVLKTERVEKQLLELTYEAKESKRKYEEKSKLLSTENSDLLKEIEKLKKENSRLNNQLEDFKEAKRENIKLRNYVFNSNNFNSIEEDDTIDNTLDMSVFENKKIVVLGGSINWINKMKEVLPNAIYATSETKNSNLNFLDKDSYVFINTNMGHDFYNKIQAITGKLNLDYHYISMPGKRTITNVNNSLKTMANVLKGI